VQRCQDSGVIPLHLDVAVHDMASHIASNVNNGGLESQIEFLVQHGNERDTVEIVEDAIEVLKKLSDDT